MHLQIGPEAPLLVQIAAASALVLHIGGASVGMVSGAVAVAAPKGGRMHRASGNVFFVSMLIMSGVGAIVAPMLPDRTSGAMGLFTFYLTATAWLTVWRPAARIGRLEIAALFLGLAAGVAFVSLGWIGSNSPKGLVDGQPSELGFVAGAIATLAVVCDLAMIRRGGISGVPRVARHLWRMCLALFVVWGSFAGQPLAQPETVRGSPWLFLPALAALALMAFWLVWVRIPRRGRRAVRAAA